MNCTLIIPAAGIGTRFGGAIPKQYTEIAGEPILVTTIERFLETGAVERVIVAIAETDSWWEEIAGARRHWESVASVPGGETRQESVMAALRIAGEHGLVAVHDAVRPYWSPETFERVLRAAEESGAALPALRIRETVHRVIDGRISETADRSELWTAQTPQCFRLELLQEVMERAFHEAFAGTDEASIVSRYGHPVRVIEGDVGNIKVTTPEDVLAVEQFLKKERS